jgi:AraC family transcriptional regulator
VASVVIKEIGMNGRLAPALSLSRRMQLQWPSLRVESVWLPPFCGHAPNQPNRVEVVFSAHKGVALELIGRVHTVDVEPGAMFVVGNEPTSLVHVQEYSDTLEMYPDMALLRSCAERHGLRHFSLQPSLGVRERATFRRDAVVLAVAHVLRQACMGQLSVSDIEADSMAHLLAQRVLQMQHGIDDSASTAPARRLNARSIAALAEYIEDRLFDSLTLEELAQAARLSLFHFARCFKASTGSAPHQYVLARRIDWAKRQIMTTNSSIKDVAWAIGFENLSHFRRQFAKHVGVLPGSLRAATQPSSN